MEASNTDVAYPPNIGYLDRTTPESRGRPVTADVVEDMEHFVDTLRSKGKGHEKEARDHSSKNRVDENGLAMSDPAAGMYVYLDYTGGPDMATVNFVTMAKKVHPKLHSDDRINPHECKCRDNDAAHR